MDLFKNWAGSRGVMQLLIIKLVCCLAWLSTVALGQLEIGEGVTGSVNFPSLGITCVGNLAVFVTSLIRGRLDSEIGARDVLDILASPKLNNIDGTNGKGLTTTTKALVSPNCNVSVVMLSNGSPNSSVKEFMKANASYAHSILLEFLPSSASGTCIGRHDCNCIVFPTVETITSMLTCQMPGTLKRHSDSNCLLPCQTCLTSRCHEELLRVGGSLPVERERESKLVPTILDKISVGSIPAGKPICICIPVRGASNDVWTNVLIRSFRSKDADGRGVRVMASEALEGYLARAKEGQEGSTEYSTSSFMVPRLTEVVINLVLTFWFRVDGFSSALVARRTVRDFLVDTKGSGFAANAFLSEAMVKSDDNNTQVCQVLTFRSNFLSIKSLSFMVGFVNLISCIGWALLIAFDVEADTSPPPSMPIIVAIIAAIGAALGMDLASIDDFFQASVGQRVLLAFSVFTVSVTLPVTFLILLCRREFQADPKALFPITVALEIACIVSWSTLAGTLGIKGFGRWIYAAFHIMVWLKWAAASIHLNTEISVEFFGKIPKERAIFTYASAFFLNAVLAGVRCKWEPWPWRKNRLFSRKLGP